MATGRIGEDNREIRSLVGDNDRWFVQLRV